MSLEQNILVGPKAVYSDGAAAYFDIQAKEGWHSHWTHQVVLSLDNAPIECLCSSHFLIGAALFVPAGLLHSVKPQRLLSLFLEPGRGYEQQLLGERFDPQRMALIDAETAQVIKSCFLDSNGLSLGMSAFQEVFKDAPLDQRASGRSSHWKALLDYLNKRSQPPGADHKGVGVKGCSSYVDERLIFGPVMMLPVGQESLDFKDLDDEPSHIRPPHL